MKFLHLQFLVNIKINKEFFDILKYEPVMAKSTDSSNVYIFGSSNLISSNLHKLNDWVYVGKHWNDVAQTGIFTNNKYFKKRERYNYKL